MATSIFSAKLTPALFSLLKDVPLESLSRHPAKRLSASALPHIGRIELVSSTDFENVYGDLYVSMFPDQLERERVEHIINRLAAEEACARVGLAPYRIVGIRDGNGEAIGAAQFSILPLRGPKFAVPYLQYIYVRHTNRRQDMSEVLHTMVLAVTSAEAGSDRRVPFTIFETEPPGYGDDMASQAWASERNRIHSSAGGVAMVLRRERDGKVLSAHVQPGLEETDPPSTLSWVIRTSPNQGQSCDVTSIAKDIVAAFYQSLRDEKIPEKNIRLAESIFEARCRGAEFELIPLVEVPVHTD